MYTMSKDPNGIVLLCHNCSHVERIDSFREGFGDRQSKQHDKEHASSKHAKYRSSRMSRDWPVKPTSGPESSNPLRQINRAILQFSGLQQQVGIPNGECRVVPITMKPVQHSVREGLQ